MDLYVSSSSNVIEWAQSNDVPSTLRCFNLHYKDQMAMKQHKMYTVIAQTIGIVSQNTNIIFKESFQGDNDFFDNPMYWFVIQIWRRVFRRNAEDLVPTDDNVQSTYPYQRFLTVLPSLVERGIREFVDLDYHTPQGVKYENGAESYPPSFNEPFLFRLYKCGAPLTFPNDGQANETFSSRNVHKFLTDSSSRVYFGWRYAGFIHSEDDIRSDDESSLPQTAVNIMHQFLANNIHIIVGNDGYRVEYKLDGGRAAKRRS